ncbi:MULTISPECIES: NUDIX domain-containing protein [unclassified Curtobacterium]|uniref:NUDIX hydrolase n=1 Tax=unclassified Curtobacterium TaxID=257496 RepID=UPI000DA8D8CC|nr:MULTISPECIES: NUDIX domain-containing protein [unclassified Curtobacterium]PZE37808.1 DNA mismatch repair protein MutT [Curtobacterium sp. MCPF17_031]PZE59830.1 DNA mismatch repair protein MutT [Curtobacterium sp. MCPF17_001]PZF63209.1 DNA mismatch repair protein MutT [Curtobacterium sp. MCPF17_047]
MSGGQSGPVIAAGAVVWREQDGEPLVLLIHREHHKDVSFPKGKVDPGESIPEAAVREIDEETGYRVHLGAPLGRAEYVLPSGRDKVVHYWSARVSRKEAERAGQFRPNDEVAAVEWVSIDDARARLTYERDVAILDRFAERAAADEHDTFALIALRHAKTVPGSDWDGPDATRPLLPLGRAQAKAAAAPVAAFGPKKIVSSTAARCLATVEPLSARTKVGVSDTPDISQDAHERGTADVKGVVRKRLDKAKTAVLCSHGPVLPDIVARIATDTADDAAKFDLRRAAMLSVGEFAVMHIAGRKLIAVETHRNTVSA